MNQAPSIRRRERAAKEAMNRKARASLLARGRFTVKGHAPGCHDCHQFAGKIFHPGCCPGIKTDHNNRPACWMNEDHVRPVHAREFGGLVLPECGEMQNGEAA